MAGLLAGNMLRRHDVRILEKSDKLPDNHKAVLRFRNMGVSDATGIPFEKTTVRKGFWTGKEVKDTLTLAEANAYSLIVTGGADVFPRSANNLSTETRYIAPSDFVAQMAKNLNIEFGTDFSLTQNYKGHEVHTPVISTLPMPVMMDLVGWDRKNIQFNARPIYVFRCKISTPNFHIHQTLYSTGADWYRASIHRNQLIIEMMDATQPEMENWSAGGLYGFANGVIRAFIGGSHAQEIELSDFEVKRQHLGKITEIDEEERKKFILHLTDVYGIYSLGRFATWRPLLLDDLVKDIKQIETLISSESTYSRRLTPCL